MFKENLGIKLFALALAILIWLQSILVSDHRSTIHLPVRLSNVPAHISLENMPNSIPFIVEGKGMDILKLAIARPVAEIDAGDISVGLDLLNLQNYTVNIPENNKTRLIGPAESNQIAVHTDVFLQKSVAIKPAFKDRQAQSRLKEYSYHIRPDKVTLNGPKTKVQAISEILTSEITSDMLNQSIIELPLISPDHEIKLSEKSVLLTISGTQESTKVFSNIALPPGYMLSNIAARIQASSDIIEDLEPSMIKVIISEEADARDMYEIKLELPEGFSTIAITPNKVRKRSR